MTEIEEIKQKLDIVDIVGQYVPLKKSGKNYKGVCPFHNEKTPSFMVNQELQIYKCFGCNEAGDMFSFLEKIEGYDFKQALVELAERAGVKLKETSHNSTQDGNKSTLFEINETTKKFYHFVLTKHSIGKPALLYLTDKRRLTLETINKWELGYAPNSWTSLTDFMFKKNYQEKDLLKAGVVAPDKFEKKSIDKFRGRIMFPLTGINEKVLGFGGRTITDREPKYLNTQETSIFHKESFLFGLNKTRMEIKSKGAVIVEGYMDAISAYQAGITNVVATCGTALTIPHLKILSRYTKDLTFCFDSDNAGVNATLRAIEMCIMMDLNPKVAILPTGVKDIDDLAKTGVEKVEQAVKASIPAFDFIIKTVELKNDVNSPIGKKKIMEEVCIYLSKTNNPVLREHYAAILGERVSVHPEAIIKYLEEKGNSGTENAAVPIVNQNTAKSPLDYFLALVLAQKSLDKSKEILQNLAPEGTPFDQSLGIYTKLLEFIEKSPDLSVKCFIQSLSDQDLVKARELSLWDIGDIGENEEAWEAELKNTIKRVEKDFCRKQMGRVSAQLKEAERLEEIQKIKDLTREFEKLSKKLNN